MFELVPIVTGIASAAIGVTMMAISRPFTRNKLKLSAILYGIIGIMCLFLAYLTFKQMLFYASSGFILLTVAIVIAEFVIKNKYDKLGKAIS